MADIVSLVNNMSEDDLRMQIALIDNVNFSNAMKETGQKLISGLVDIANAFSETIGFKNGIDYEIKMVSDRVRDDCIRHKALGRDKLVQMLSDRLIKLSGDNSEESEISGEEISRKIIDEAAAAYGIDKYMPPAHKIEEVSIKYNNAFLNNLMSQLTGLSSAEKKAYGEHVNGRLAMASMETKRQVQKVLNPKTFTGEGVIDALRSSRSIAKLDSVLKLIGMDAFKSVEAEIKTMYGAVRTMNRMSRYHAARYVWKASHAGDVKFYVSQDLLPSYIPADRAEETAQADKEFELVRREVEEAERELSKREREEELREKQLEEAREKYEQASEQYDSVQRDFTELESQKDEYMRNMRPEDETKQYYAQVNETKRRLDRAEEDYGRKRKKLHAANKALDEAKDETAESRARLETVKESAAVKTSDRVRELKRMWTAYFFRFTFEDKVFEDAVLTFSRGELLHIEETLKEAHDAKSVRAVNSSEDRIFAYTGTRRPAVITYDGRMITGIEKGSY